MSNNYSMSDIYVMSGNLKECINGLLKDSDKQLYNNLEEWLIKKHNTTLTQYNDYQHKKILENTEF